MTDEQTKSAIQKIVDGAKNVEAGKTYILFYAKNAMPSRLAQSLREALIDR